MKITEVSNDGLGVSALIAAAGKIHDLTEERNVTLGVIEGDALGEDKAVGAIMARRDSGAGLPVVAVTIERNPRVLYLEADAEPVEHELGGATSHLFDIREGRKTCICDAPCCNNADGWCTCPECTDPAHDHPGRT